MPTDAVVLAGSSSGERLRRFGGSLSKAAVRLYGLPMVEYVARALLQAQGVNSVTIVGAPNLVSVSSNIRRAARWVTSGRSFSDSLSQGLKALPQKERLLVVSCDVPMLTPGAVDHFLMRCQDEETDVVYPLVPRDVMEATLPGVRRTYLCLRDGTFATGNIALVRPAFSSRQLTLLDEAARRRKHPAVLGGLLGWRPCIGLLLRRICLAELERRVGETLGIKVRAVVVPHAEIGFDVDSPVDYLTALRWMAKNVGRVGASTNPDLPRWQSE